MGRLFLLPFAFVIGCNALFGLDDLVATDEAHALAAGGAGGAAGAAQSAGGDGSSAANGGGGAGGCDAGPCFDPSCDDGMKNGSETDLDCGGRCATCADGLDCARASDCESGVCKAETCAVPTCTDRVANGGETGTDCGSGCPPCTEGEPCLVATDCESTICDDDVCSLLNGCSPVAALDLTAESEVIVAIQSGGYDPKCFTITAGTLVTFSGSFSSHDLYGGEVKAGQKLEDPASPFMPPTTSGSTKTFDGLVTPGMYGFYCKQHGGSGANGAVFVVP